MDDYVAGIGMSEIKSSFRWKTIEKPQQEGIKNYLTSAIITKSQTEEALIKERTLLNKLNLILVAVLKHVCFIIEFIFFF